MYIGIDPGLTGAIAVLKKKKLITVLDMPVEAKHTGKGMQTSAILLYTLLSGIKIKHAYIERVHAMPGQGVTSIFTFGRGLGVIEGVLSAFEVPVTFITPHMWKKTAGLIGRDKDAARTKVLQKWPHHAPFFSRKKDIGRADAALIGYYGKFMASPGT